MVDKYLVIFFTLMFLGIFPIAAQGILDENKYCILSQKTKTLSSWSFDLVCIGIDDISQNKDTLVLCHVDATPDYTDIFQGDENIRLAKDSFCIVNHSCGSIAIGTKQADTLQGISLYETAFNHILGTLGYSAYWISQPQISRGTIIGSNDTIVDGHHCLGISEVRQLSFGYNYKTQKYDIPIIDSIRYYYDYIQSWVTSVEVRSGDVFGYKYHFHIYNIKENIMFDNDGLFTADSIQDKAYKVYHLPSEVPISLAGLNISDSEGELSEELLDFPLVSPSNDTIRLKFVPGWKLLSFWTYSCGACLRHFGQLQNEKALQGFRTLDSCGIKLFCINYESGNTNRFCEVATEYDMSDIIYAGRDLRGIDVPYTPYDVFCSPDNKIVFRGQVKSYSKLMKLKRRYVLMRPIRKFFFYKKFEHEK